MAETTKSDCENVLAPDAIGAGAEARPRSVLFAVAVPLTRQTGYLLGDDGVWFCFISESGRGFTL